MAASTGTVNTTIKVAVAGPTGTLGPPILTQLLRSSNPEYHLTLLTRDASKTKTTVENIASHHGLSTTKIDIKVVADYTDVSSLTTLLEGQDALIVLLNREFAAQQIALTNAAIAAHVKHLIPSSFGTGTRHPYLHALPAIQGKVQMEDHLFAAIAAQPPPAATDGRRKTTFTSINNGIFLELAVDKSVVINLRPGGKTPVFDGGDVPFAMTALDDIAVATVAAVRLGVAGDPRVLDQVLNVQTVCVTQNELLAYARALVPGRSWEVVDLDTAELEKASRARLEAGDTSPDALRGFMVRSTFGMGLGRFDEVHDEVLGVVERDGVWMKEYLAKELQRSEEVEG